MKPGYVRLKDRWLHKKGNEYQELVRGRAASDIREGDSIVVYGHPGDDWWARVESEFMDGRFTKLDRIQQPVITHDQPTDYASVRWHSPGLGEIHSDDHRFMLFCEAEIDDPDEHTPDYGMDVDLAHHIAKILSASSDGECRNASAVLALVQKGIDHFICDNPIWEEVLKGANNPLQSQLLIYITSAITRR